MNERIDPDAKVEHAKAILEGLADKWAAEVNLTGMIKNVVAPMSLKPSVLASVRVKMAARAEVLIDAIVRQAFIEATYRAVTGMSDERAEMEALGLTEADIDRGIAAHHANIWRPK